MLSGQVIKAMLAGIGGAALVAVSTPTLSAPKGKGGGIGQAIGGLANDGHEAGSAGRGGPRGGSGNDRIFNSSGGFTKAKAKPRMKGSR